MQEHKEEVSEELVIELQNAINKRKESHREWRRKDENRGMYVLQNLYESDRPLTPSDLRRILNVSMPRITTILNSLEGNGLIERHTSQNDRRRLIIQLTESGEKAVLEHKQSIYDQTRRLIEKIGPEDTQAFFRILAAQMEISREDN